MGVSLRRPPSGNCQPGACGPLRSVRGRRRVPAQRQLLGLLAHQPADWHPLHVPALSEEGKVQVRVPGAVLTAHAAFLCALGAGGTGHREVPRPAARWHAVGAK
eukprot:902008-Lingulodinium_polyedra.AAC.1